MSFLSVENIDSLDSESITDITAIASSRKKLEDWATSWHTTVLYGIGYWSGEAIGQGANDLAVKIIRLATNDELRDMEANATHALDLANKLKSMIKRVQAERVDSGASWTTKILLGGLVGIGGWFVYIKFLKKRG